METRTLRYFLMIAREENMTNAANLLHISQSALSRQMADLETQLHTTLFVRTNRKTVLTEDGWRLYKRANEIIDLIDKTENELQTKNNDFKENIYIGAGETKAFLLLCEVMHEMEKEYSNIHFHIYSGNTIDVMEKLEHGLLDFGLLFEKASEDKYEIIPIPISDTVGLLVKKEDKLALKEFITEEELIGLPLILSTKADTNPDSLFSLKNLKQLNRVGTYNLLYNASLMVQEGMGYALTIDGIISTENDNPLRFIPMNPKREMHTFFVWKKNQKLSKGKQLFIEKLQKSCIQLKNKKL